MVDVEGSDEHYARRGLATDVPKPFQMRFFNFYPFFFLLFFFVN